MSESLTFIIDAFQVTEPTPEEAIAFVDDIAFETDMYEVGLNEFKEANHYKCTLSYNDSTDKQVVHDDMSYSIVKHIVDGVVRYDFLCVNDWNVEFDLNPFNSHTYPETYRAITGTMTSSAIEPSGGYLSDATFNGRFEVVMTKEPDTDKEEKKMDNNFVNVSPETDINKMLYLLECSINGTEPETPAYYPDYKASMAKIAHGAEYVAVDPNQYPSIAESIEYILKNYTVTLIPANNETTGGE